MCVDASQSTSRHSIMDGPEQTIWVSLTMEVLMFAIWMWLHGNDPCFTFEIAQHSQTWSQLDRNDDSFLLTSLWMTVLEDVSFISLPYLFGRLYSCN